MSTKTAGRIREINLVIVASTDQDRSVAFYESLGFEKLSDLPFGGRYRWVEVYPSKGTTGIALVPPQYEGQTGVQTGISLTSEDIDATHALFKSLGVDVDAEVARMGEPVPPMFWFRDPDQNTLIVVQAS